ncbi:penicillin-binding protein 1C [Verrucomicrobiota bacterium sgz303538]
MNWWKCGAGVRSRLRKIVVAGTSALVLAAIALVAALHLTPLPAELEAGFPGSTEFLDREGLPLRTMLVEQSRFSRWCELSEVSPQLVVATLSAEDKRFRSHIGLDFQASARAIRDALRSGHTTSGASTITQQLVKLARPGPRTIARKIQEIWLALRIEQTWSKDRILTEYLNRLDYGNLQIGIASASRYYFHKPPSDLSTAEAAFLAGLPKAPSRLDPHSNFKGARERQRWVLARMQANGCIDAIAHEDAVSEPLRLAKPAREFEAPHFVDLLLKRRGIVPAHGGRIYTTLDLELNRFVERSLAEQLQKIADKHATSGAVVVIHNPTGDVLALAGSGDYFRPGAGQINGAWMIRSPGSAVKPFTYILALERGANPCTVVADVPTDFPTSTGLYRPNNYNHRFYGPVSLRFALGNSLNVAAIRALQLGGGPDVLQRRLAELGITTLDQPTDYYGLGLTLGNGEVRLLELASAFGTIGRLGVHRPYRMLLREPGNVAAGVQVCDRRATYLLADMLSDNSARAASFGLNSYLSFDFPVACKTGTSSDYRDNWAIGCTPEFTVGVWVGNADGSPMRSITGVTGAAPVMHDVFVHLHQQRGTSWFARPPEIKEVTVNPLTGRRVADVHSSGITEKCQWPPEPEHASDRNAAGQIVLPSEYAPWLSSPQNTLGDLVVCQDSSPQLHILNPPAGAIYFLDPDLPGDAQRISLRAEGSGAVAWSSPTLRCEADGTRQLIRLQEGRHVISARDTATGRETETWIEVKAL